MITRPSIAEQCWLEAMRLARDKYPVGYEVHVEDLKTGYEVIVVVTPEMKEKNQ